MRNGFITILATLIAHGGMALGQTESQPDLPPVRASVEAPSDKAPVVTWSEAGPCVDRKRVWANAEYLLWWIKNGNTPPLVTTGNASDTPPASLDKSATRVLFGGSLDYGSHSGFRGTLGAWLDDTQVLGWEISGFFLEQRTIGFNAASDGTGKPLLALPYFNTHLKREDSLLVSLPSRPGAPGYAGSITVASSSSLWGAEANGVWNSCRSEGLEIEFLAGFRFLDLQEDLGFNYFSRDLLPANARNIVNYSERFDARNQFYGGQLGGRIHSASGRFGFDLAGKVALGSTHSVVERSGQISGPVANSVTFPIPSVTTAGGLYTQPSNIGRLARDQFSVVPSVQAKVSLDLTRNLRATMAYDFLYWSQVARAGDQVDRTINPQQSPVFAIFPFTNTGTARPTSIFERTDFLAHGMSVGLEFSW